MDLPVVASFPEYVRPADLPDYLHPPVSEVVLACRYESPDIGTTRMALLARDLFGDDLPTIVEQPPIVMPIEDLDGTPVQQLDFKILDRPPSPRLWFLSEQGQELVQVQTDFFARNWRKQAEGDAYPHYGAVRDGFIDGLGRLFDRLNRELGDVEPIPIQCEVSFINLIVAEGPWSGFHEASHVLRVLADESDEQLPPREGVQLGLRYPLLSQDLVVGRLHISAQPAQGEDGRPLMVLTLTARGRPPSTDLAGVVSLMDTGHESIVRTFDQLTTSAMHDLWRKTDGG